MTQTETRPLGALLERARQLAERAGIRNPAPTVLATEPLAFWSEQNARDWLRLNHFPPLSEPAAIGPIVVMAIQVGVYQLVAHWPSKEQL